MQVQCAQCAQTFEAQRSRARFCSDGCRNRWHRSQPGKKKYVYAKSTDRSDIECAGCGRLFNGRRRKFCTAECRDASAASRAAARYQERRSADDHLLDKTCAVCGKSFRAKRIDALLCGEYACTYEYAKVRNGVRQCEHCGADFRAFSSHTRYCSIMCAQAPRRLQDYADETERQTIKGHRRRAKIKAVYVEDVLPSLVYERDGWICQLCHEPVDETLHGWNKMAATIDHIIPLKEGGLHCYSNIQLAHRSCNSKKGARWQGQLVLI